MGGNCLQIFSSSPRGWRISSVDNKTAALFREKSLEFNVSPVYFHASYLINLADTGKTGLQSREALIAELITAQKMGVRGSVIHLGSYKNQENGEKFHVLIDNIKKVLDSTPADTFFIIENAGNRKIGQSQSEIQTILQAIDNGRTRVCLDSCHLYSAGYSLRTQTELDGFIKEFDEKIGLEKLELWHLNDSRDPYNSGRDRHENIGKGTIGLDEFKLIMNHPRLKHLPFIIETPGFEGNGPDKQNIDSLKNLI
jgi:deoxyribonuclease-4